MSFFITLSLVATLFAYAVPAFLLIKTKVVKETAIQGIASILLYISTPSIIINSFITSDFNTDTLIELLIFSALFLVLQVIVLGGAYLILKKHFDDARARIATAASSLGNYGFFGIPLLSELLPDMPQAMIFVAIVSIFMNFFAFTFGSMIMSGDTKYISVKKLFINPSVLSAIVAIPLFIFNVRLPQQVMSILDTFVKMSTPLCMFVLGMRLATVKFVDLFKNPYSFFAVFLKQIFMPVSALLITFLFPFEPMIEKSLVILCSCPIASVVLNLSEVIESGQKHAVNNVLLGTLLSIITIPLMMLLC